MCSYNTNTIEMLSSGGNNVTSESVSVPTETMFSGLTLGGSGFGVSAANVSLRALRASRDMKSP